MNIIDEHILRSKQVMANDINSLKYLYDTLDWNLIYKAAQILADTHSIFLSGIGKSGLISKKISSTFASIGMQSHFLHPIEAIHGDIGLVKNVIEYQCLQMSRRFFVILFQTFRCLIQI